MSNNLKSIFLILTVCLALGCSSGPRPIYLEESGNGLQPPSPPTPPKNELIPFDEYVQTNTQQIREAMQGRLDPSKFQGDYTLEDAVEFRAPFEVPIDDAMCPEGVDAGGSNKGFLLIHGLTDSPYLMRGLAASTRAKFPCAVIRAVVLPGHSTVPGDSNLSDKPTEMTYRQWLATTRYGIRSFDDIDEVDSLYVMTFSTGAPLLINHIAGLKNPEEKLKGAVMISAAIKAKNRLAFLAPAVQYFVPWSTVFPEEDAVRYETFSTHAAAEFYKLTKNLLDEKYRFKLPLFIAISADDDTVSAEAALKYFCSAETDTKRMVWYQHADTNKKEKLAYFDEGKGACKQNIFVREAEEIGLPDYYKSFAHTALSVPPSDPHYGVNGAYKQCKHYFEDKDFKEFEECKRAVLPSFVVGETTDSFKERYGGIKSIRRGVYNPDYETMETEIFSFIGSIN